MKNKTKVHDHDSEEQSEDEDDEKEKPTVVGLTSVPDIRTLTLYGPVDEKISAQVVYSLFAYKELKKLIPIGNKKPPNKFKEVVEPLEFIISTNGGNASDMFAIYDAMKHVKKTMQIHTLGLGKVMSAGVLLLASGTKGHRTVGKNCRVMIHSVIAGSQGSLHEIRAEVDEIINTQEQYIGVLAQETNMSVAKIKKLLNEKKNIYMNAEDCIKHGIADKIL